jgi:hypothetical protein
VGTFIPSSAVVTLIMSVLNKLFAQENDQSVVQIVPLNLVKLLPL